MGWLKTNGYEVTERGKISFALVIVLILFIVPAIIITAFAWSSQPPPDNNINGNPDGQDPGISNGSGLNPDGQDPNGEDPVNGEDPKSGEDGAYDPPDNPPDDPPATPDPSDDPPVTPDPPDDPPTTPDPPDDPPTTPDLPDNTDSPEVGPVSMSRSNGTMRFMFSPEMQETLDLETVSMIGDFVTSPRNTSNAQLIIEVPELSAGDTAELKTALTDVFGKHGVKQDSISFVEYMANTNERSFNVRMSFVQSRNIK